MEVLMRVAPLPLLLALAILSSASPVPGIAPAGGREGKEIRAPLKVYAPVRLQVDLSSLSRQENEARGRIVAAVNAVDEIYWRQMGRQALEARTALAEATDPVDRLYRDFVMINYGPFDIRKEME